MEYRIDLGETGVQRLYILVERGNDSLVGLLLRVYLGETGIGLRRTNDRVSALKSSAPRRLSFELELKLGDLFP